jgi:hypothetical protein
MSRAGALVIAALLLPGPLRAAHAGAISPSEILADANQFDGRPVFVQGTIADVRELGATAYTFTLGDGRRAVSVVSPGTPACGASAAATVEGVFRKDKRDGYRIYSEVEATRVTCR